jgi:intracellular multiplication protein IcmP
MALSSSVPSKHDSMGFVCLTVVGLVCAFAWFAWHSWHADLAYRGLQWTWHLLSVVDWPWMPDVISQWRLHAAQLAAAPQSVSWSELMSVMNTGGYVWVWLPVLMTLRSMRLATSHRAHSTRRQLNASTLPWVMAKHSPAVIPSLYYGDDASLLLNVDPPEHRSACHPHEWVAQHGLLVNGTLNRTRCHELLTADLGPRIQSLDALQPHERALFAVLGLRLLVDDSQKMGSAQALLDTLNRSCHTGTHLGARGYPDLSLADAAFAHCAQHPDARHWLHKHPYPRTMLHAMHKAALRSGALASSHFRWLKGIDRGLWYALNTTGRKVAFMESAAVFTQAQWEEFAFDSGYQLTQPYLEDAINGVEDFLIKIHLMPARAHKEP